MAKTYMVKWHNSDAGAWQDIIPDEIIDSRSPKRGETHELVHRTDGVILAHFDVEPTADGHLLLRYGGQNAAANRAAKVFRGDVRLNPTSFAQATTLEWRDEGKTKFEPLKVTIWHGDIEGTRLTSTTTRPKRSHRLKAIKRALGREVGRCEACDQEHKLYGDVRHACFEVHHRRDLAAGETINGLATWLISALIVTAPSQPSGISRSTASLND